MKLAHTPKFNETSINQVLNHALIPFEGTISTKLKTRCIVPYVGLKFKVGIENNFSYKLNKNGETYLSPFLLDFLEKL